MAAKDQTEVITSNHVSVEDFDIEKFSIKQNIKPSNAKLLYSNTEYKYDNGKVGPLCLKTSTIKLSKGGQGARVKSDDELKTLLKKTDDARVYFDSLSLFNVPLGKEYGSEKLAKVLQEIDKYVNSLPTDHFTVGTDNKFFKGALQPYDLYKPVYPYDEKTKSCDESKDPTWHKLKLQMNVDRKVKTDEVKEKVLDIYVVANGKKKKISDCKKVYDAVPFNSEVVILIDINNFWCSKVKDGKIYKCGLKASTSNIQVIVKGESLGSTSTDKVNVFGANIVSDSDNDDEPVKETKTKKKDEKSSKKKDETESDSDSDSDKKKKKEKANKKKMDDSDSDKKDKKGKNTKKQPIVSDTDSSSASESGSDDTSSSDSD